MWAGGALLAALGWWFPWVLHERGAAALALLGLDLGEFWKFTAAWSAGQLALERHLFFLPPPLAAILLALWGAGQRGPRRWLLLLPTLFLSLVILPAAEFVLEAFKGIPLYYEEATFAREYGFQLYLASGGVLVSQLSLVVGPRWPARWPARLALLVALAGALLPPWALWRGWPLLQNLYGGGAQVGPGVVLSALGFLLVALATVWQLRPRQPISLKEE